MLPFGSASPDPSPGAGTSPGDPTVLAQRLVAETARRQQAEARADTATATAEAETARAALVGLRATAVQGIASVQARDRADRMAAIHHGLTALRDDLDGLRAVAEAAIAAGRATPAPLTSAARIAEPSEPPPFGPDLARSAQELLAQGRLDVADEVIRGLEDAAARLRAQAPPPSDD